MDWKWGSRPESVYYNCQIPPVIELQMWIGCESSLIMLFRPMKIIFDRNYLGLDQQRESTKGNRRGHREISLKRFLFFEKSVIVTMYSYVMSQWKWITVKTSHAQQLRTTNSEEWILNGHPHSQLTLSTHLPVGQLFFFLPIVRQYYINIFYDFTRKMDYFKCGHKSALSSDRHLTALADISKFIILPAIRVITMTTTAVVLIVYLQHQGWIQRWGSSQTNTMNWGLGGLHPFFFCNKDGQSEACRYGCWWSSNPFIIKPPLRLWKIPSHNLCPGKTKVGSFLAVLLWWDTIYGIRKFCVQLNV